MFKDALRENAKTHLFAKPYASFLYYTKRQTHTHTYNQLISPNLKPCNPPSLALSLFIMEVNSRIIKLPPASSIHPITYISLYILLWFPSHCLHMTISTLPFCFLKPEVYFHLPFCYKSKHTAHCIHTFFFDCSLNHGEKMSSQLNNFRIILTLGPHL